MSWSISSYFRRSSLLKCVWKPQSNREKNSLKLNIFGIQRRSKLSVLVPSESSSAVLVMICRKSVSICNRSLARLVDSSRNRAFGRGYPHLMRSDGGLVEPWGSSLTPLKSIVNAETFMCMLFWSISNGFGAIHS